MADRTHAACPPLRAPLARSRCLTHLNSNLNSSQAEGGAGGDFTVNADGTVERVVTRSKALDPAMLEKVRGGWGGGDGSWAGQGLTGGGRLRAGMTQGQGAVQGS